MITKYEKARIIGTRAVQISMNAPPMIDTKGEIDSLKIAEMEFEQNKIPFKIVRTLPNGKKNILTLDILKSKML